jgi:threonylcarbamoyladenosine tRNA methylthiotransferase MtaB
VDERLAGALSHEAVCPHFHIPVQSGSDRVLKHAGRHYLASGVVETVLRLRKAKPGAFLAADIIVGLPGESDEDFADTLSLVGELKFARLHVFPFSARPGTAFFKEKNLVPERVAGERAASLRALSSSLHAAYTSGFKGRVLEVLLEEENGDVRSGLSENYLRVSVKDVPQSVKQGMVVPVLVGRTSPGLAGRYQQIFEKLQ